MSTMASGTLPPEELDNIGALFSGGTPPYPVYKLAGDNYSIWTPDYYGGNGTLEDLRPLSVVAPIASAMAFLSILTTLGNALVIHAIRTEKRLQTVANYFICSLAVADLLIGLYVMPLSIVYFVTGEWHMGLIVCQAWLSVDYVCSTASIFNLFILSLDRYWSIRYPLKYLRTRTVKRASKMITVVWIVSSFWLIPVVGWHYFTGQKERKVDSQHCDTEFHYHTIFKVITASGNFYVPMGIMVGIYCKIFHEIRKRSALDLGRRSVGRKSSSRINAETLAESPRDLANRAHEEPQWVNDDQDSSSSSKDTSEGQVDTNSTKRTKGKQAPINLQLKNISQLTFLTMGLHPGMLDGKSSPIKEPPHKSSTRKTTKLDHSNCSCNRLTARPKETKLVSKQESHIQGDKNRSKHLLSVDYIPKHQWNEQLREELRPLKEQDEDNEDKGSNGHSRSILRRSNTAEQIYNGAPKARRISFSDPDDTNWKDCKVTYKDGYTAGQKVATDGREAVRIHEPRTRERNNRGVRNGTVCRLLSNDTTTTSGSGGTESDEDGGSPRSGHVRLGAHGPHGPHGPHGSHGPHGPPGPGNKFSLTRFGTSIRHGQGRASETLKRIRKMSISKEKKAAKQLGIIVGCFVSCWLPYFIVFMIVAFCKDCVHPEVYNALIWLGYINSTLNPFIYPMCNTNFRKAFKRILHIGNVPTRQRR